MTDLHRCLLAWVDDCARAADDDRYPVAQPLAALRAVLELHEPVTYLRRPLDHPICETCSTDDDLHDVPWPCSTVRTIAQHLGIQEAPDGQ